MNRAAIGIAGLVLAVASAALAQSGDEATQSSAFMRSRTTDGYTAFETATRVYRRPDGTGPVVSLVGVVHIGDRAYYDELVGILGRSDIVLYESVLPRGAFGTRGRTDTERQRRTQDAMLFVRSLAEGFERANGRPAASLEELRAFTVGRDTRLARPFDLACVDGWGRRIGYSSTGGAYAFVSLGADGASGGSDENLDLVLPRVARPKPAEKAAANGAGKGAEKKSDEGRDLYKEFADALGVSLQVRSIDYDRPGWEPADLPMEELLDRLWKRGERSMTLESLSNQDGFAQGVLRFFLSMVSDSPQFKKLVIQALGGAGDAVGRGAGGRRAGLGEVDERIIIDERNDAVIDELAHLLGKQAPPSSVAIFYGAAHMGDFEATLRERWGLEPAEVVWSSAMGVDDWNDKKVRERITALDAVMKAIQENDAAGAYPACARLEWRLEQLRKRVK
ncbi:MAG: hypothetical protein RLY21_2770 [Planctomycetota bacterium]|jgi:hypothetical protein